jgi:hypothetical protein
MSRLLILTLFVLAVPSLSAAPAPPPKVPKALLQERLKAASDTYNFKLQSIRSGIGTPTELVGWSRRWLDAQLALCENKKDRLAAYQAHVERTRQEERLMHAIVKAGQGKQADASAATYYRTEAEIMLLEAGGQLPKEVKRPDEEDLLKPRPQKKVVEEEGDQPRPKRKKIRVEEEEPAPKKKPPAKEPS